MHAGREVMRSTALRLPVREAVANAGLGFVLAVPANQDKRATTPPNRHAHKVTQQ